MNGPGRDGSWSCRRRSSICFWLSSGWPKKWNAFALSSGLLTRSLGMLIIDEIRMPSRSPLVKVIGGSSTFVSLDLRLFTQNPASVGCIVLAGSDFLPEVEEEVNSWGTTSILKKSTDLKSSRGLLIYEDDTFGPKTFEYTTPPIRATQGI